MNTLTLLFDWLLAASLRASVLTLAVVAVQWMLHCHLSPRWRYALWLPVLAVLLMPVLPQSRWSVESAFLSAPRQQAVTVHEVAVVAAAIPGEASVVAAPASAPASLGWQNVLLFTWMSGAAAILLFGAVSFTRVLLRFKATRLPVGDKLQALIHQTVEEVGLRRAPQVWISPSISSPAVTGLLRPTLLLPERFDHAFTLSEVRLILQHELTHLKRHDLPLNLLLCLLMALHWFNPVLWLAFFKVRADREAACDAQVLHNAPHARRVEYGHALLKVESAFSLLSLSLGFVGIFQRGAALRSRIRSIATQRRAHPAMNALAALFLLLLTFFGITQAEAPSFTVGQAAFRQGDSVRITSMLRTADLLSVSVEYELASTAEATLDLYITSQTGTGVKPFDPRQRAVIKKGRGITTLHFPRPYAGLPHVSLYDTQTRQAIGGVYFGSAEEAAASRKLDLAYMMIGTTTTAAPASGPAAFLTNKLDKIILPRVQFAGATIDEAVDFLRAKARTHDTTTTDPRLMGVPIILRKEAEPGLKITLDLTDVPLVEALRYVTELAGYKFTVESYAVLVQKAGRQTAGSGKGAATTLHVTSASAPDGAAQIVAPGNAAQIIIPSITFREATLEEAMEFMRIKAREFDPAKKGVNIVVKGETKSTARITIDLKEVPVHQAMYYLAELASHKLSSDGHSYVLTPASH